MGESVFNETNRKRVAGVLIIFVGLTLALIGRLFYIQILCHEDFAGGAASQYEMTIDGMDTRGRIFDRNMNPLTGGTYQYYYILKEKSEDRISSELLAQADAEQIGRKGDRYHVYRTETYIDDVNSRLKSEYNAYVFCSRTRYSDNQTACHLVGYLNDSEKRGVSGLERLCEDRLKAGTNKLILWADARGNILHGVHPAVVGDNQEAPRENSVVITIDMGMQKKCESLLNRPGACIVADAGTGDILALASSPTFNPNRISDYIEQDSDCLINKAIQGTYPPGSVFKLVVAAAALENKVCSAEQKFICRGEAQIEGVNITCSTAPEGGHGEIDMYEATAESCNCYYAQLGEIVGYEKILSMAERLGLGRRALDCFSEETEGNVPPASETGKWDISNISVGQGKLLVTPVQIARLTSIIALDGIERHMSVFLKDISASSDFSELATSYFSELHASRFSESNVSCFSESDVSCFSESDVSCFSESDESCGGEVRLLSYETTKVLQGLMRGVMTEGTAAHIPWTVPVWGKSGTAEAGYAGKPVKNCWFTGFCDIDTKRYVITVLIEDGTSGSGAALPVFRDIVEYLRETSIPAA